jgi:hypothetical protein
MAKNILHIVRTASVRDILRKSQASEDRREFLEDIPYSSNYSFERFLSATHDRVVSRVVESHEKHHRSHSSFAIYVTLRNLTSHHELGLTDTQYRALKNLRKTPQRALDM